MNINYKQSQFELFPHTLSSGERAARSRFLFAHLTFSLENVIVGLIVILMMIVLSYSLGVERGKRVAFKETSSPVVSSETPAAVPSLKKEKPLRQVKPEIPSVPRENASISPLRPKEVQEIVKNTYTIQVASFKDEQLAREEADILKKKGYEIYVMPKGIYSIVCVGKFLKKDEAQDVLNPLKRKYKDCLVRRL